MNLIFFFRGLVVGFLIALPVGPIGLLCLRRTLAEGHTCGFASGLGAASADAIYGSIAAFGVTFISDFLISQYGWLRLVGGLLLLCLGLETFFAKPKEETPAAKGNSLAGAYVSTFFLTIANPMTILLFAALFAGVGFAPAEVSYFSAGALVLGVFIGSALWWTLLSGGAAIFRNKFDLPRIRWTNRISGAIIMTFGVLALLKIR